MTKLLPRTVELPDPQCLAALCKRQQFISIHVLFVTLPDHNVCANHRDQNTLQICLRVIWFGNIFSLRLEVSECTFENAPHSYTGQKIIG